jgi:hypothetical protein
MGRARQEEREKVRETCEQGGSSGLSKMSGSRLHNAGRLLIGFRVASVPCMLQFEI